MTLQTSDMAARQVQTSPEAEESLLRVNYHWTLNPSLLNPCGVDCDISVFAYKTV